MFKRDPKGRFVCTDRGFFRVRKEWHFESGRLKTVSPMDEATHQRVLVDQMGMPVSVMYDAAARKRWWVYRGEIYWEDEGLTAADVRALILDRAEQSRRRVQRATARLGTAGSGVSRERDPIPDDVKTFVWQRDGGRCVRCGSQEKLEFDHIIPISKGGSSTARNLQLLCEPCNREKAGNLV